MSDRKINPCRGIGSGSGAPSACQASVQLDYNWRVGLPVRLRERTVFRDPAVSIFSFTVGMVSASPVVKQTVPFQAPAAPMAIQAALLRPVAIPPAARIYSFGCASMTRTTPGINTIVDTSPECPPASVPEKIKTSTTASACLLACSSEPVSTNSNAVPTRLFHHVVRRDAKRVDNHRDQMRETDVYDADRTHRTKITPVAAVDRVVP